MTFNGLRLDGRGKINIPKPDKITDSIALYVKRVFASEEPRSKFDLINNFNIVLDSTLLIDVVSMSFNLIRSIMFLDIRVVEVSSQIDAGIDTKPLLVDCTAACFKSKEKYFSTEEETQPWIVFDFQQKRIMYGLRAYLRVDGGARDLSSRQSK